MARHQRHAWPFLLSLNDILTYLQETQHDILYIVQHLFEANCLPIIYSPLFTYFLEPHPRIQPYKL